MLTSKHRENSACPELYNRGRANASFVRRAVVTGVLVVLDDAERHGLAVVEDNELNEVQAALGLQSEPAWALQRLEGRTRPQRAAAGVNRDLHHVAQVDVGHEEAACGGVDGGQAGVASEVKPTAELSLFHVALPEAFVQDVQRGLVPAETDL